MNVFYPWANINFIRQNSHRPREGERKSDRLVNGVVFVRRQRERVVTEDGGGYLSVCAGRVDGKMHLVVRQADAEERRTRAAAGAPRLDVDSAAASATNAAATAGRVQPAVVVERFDADLEDAGRRRPLYATEENTRPSINSVWHCRLI